MKKQWPHAPSHEVTHPGAYMVTAGTLYRQAFFDTPEKLDLLEDAILRISSELGWELQQWAVFSNHYHFVALSPEDDGDTHLLTKRIHGSTSVALNRLDQVSNRKVWYQRFDTRITHSTSYYARLNYVRTNAVHHGLVLNPEDYRWCSAHWFALRAERPFFETICSFRTDRLSVYDDF